MTSVCVSDPYAHRLDMGPTEYLVKKIRLAWNDLPDPMKAISLLEGSKLKHYYDMTYEPQQTNQGCLIDRLTNRRQFTMPRDFLELININPDWFYLWDIVTLCKQPPTGIQLGATEPTFTKHLFENYEISEWYCVDPWHSDVAQDWALQLLADTPTVYEKSLIVPASESFDINYFDIIYISESLEMTEPLSEIISAWWPKIKPGGVMAGYNFYEHWPFTWKTLDQFAKKHNLELHVFEFSDIPCDLENRHPGWWLIKPE